MGLNVYLFFNGNCEEAMNFYVTSIGGKVDMLQRYSDTPMPCDEAQKNKIMHATFTIKGSKVMCSDSSTAKTIAFGDNFSMALDYTDPAEMKAAYDKLSAGGIATMPLQDTFWGATFGMCTDKFGINWMFNHDKPKP